MELVDRKKSQAIQRNLELEEQWNVCNQEVSDWEERCLTAQARAETLESQLGEMAGQSNLSQRIQLHQQIKNENIDLRVRAGDVFVHEFLACETRHVLSTFPPPVGLEWNFLCASWISDKPVCLE